MTGLRLPIYCALLLGLSACSTMNGNSSIGELFQGDGLGSVLFGDNGESVTTENGVPVTASTNDDEQGGPQETPAPETTHAGELEILWGIDVDQRRPLSPYSFSRPAVTGDHIVIAAQDRYAHIYDLNGREQQRVLLGAPSDSGALAMSDRLVVLGDAQGILYGIDPVAGDIVWRWQMPTVMPGHPVRMGDDLLVQTGDNNVYRVSADGKKMWSFSAAQAGMSMNIMPSPLASGDICFALLSNGDAVALRGDTGDVIWRRQLLLDNDAVVLSELKTPIADPVLAGHVLVTAFYQGDIIALSARDGQQLWQRNLSLKSAPLVIDDRLFASTAGGALVELDPASGATLWKRTLGAGELVGPTLSGNSLIVADDAGEVFRISLDGRVTGSLDLPGRVDRAPIAAANGVLVRNNLGGLYLIR